VKALVLSGGGSKGSWQAGVLTRLLGEEGQYYEVICGVSVGALNGAFLAQYPLGREREASFDLGNLWRAVETSKIYKRWFPFGRLHALWRGSAYNSEPLADWVSTALDTKRIQTSGRKLRVGAVSLTTGEYRLFGEDYPELTQAVLASASFPAALCPVSMEGELWSDGGIKEITPLQGAIALGASHVDVVLCSPKSTTTPFPADANAISVAMRTIDLMSDEILNDDLAKTAMVNQLVEAGACNDKRLVTIRVFRPEKNLIESSLDFSNDKMRALLDQGYAAASRWESLLAPRLVPLLGEPG